MQIQTLVASLRILMQSISCSDKRKIQWILLWLTKWSHGSESVLGNQTFFKLHNNFAPIFENRKHNTHSATTYHTVQPVLAHSVPLQAQWLATVTLHTNIINPLPSRQFCWISWPWRWQLYDILIFQTLMIQLHNVSNPQDSNHL